MTQTNSLDAAIAAARKWRQETTHYAMDSFTDGEVALVNLLAALDAARGQAVAYRFWDSEESRWQWGEAACAEKDDELLYAAPPAAAMSAGKDWQAEAMKHAQAALYWRERCEMLEDPARKAPPTASPVEFPKCSKCGQASHPDDCQRPAKLEHKASSDCWCEPELDSVDPDTGAKVWIHRETH